MGTRRSTATATTCRHRTRCAAQPDRPGPVSAGPLHSPIPLAKRISAVPDYCAVRSTTLPLCGFHTAIRLPRRTIPTTEPLLRPALLLDWTDLPRSMLLRDLSLGLHDLNGSKAGPLGSALGHLRRHPFDFDDLGCGRHVRRSHRRGGEGEMAAPLAGMGKARVFANCLAKASSWLQASSGALRSQATVVSRHLSS